MHYTGWGSMYVIIRGTDNPAMYSSPPASLAQMFIGSAIAGRLVKNCNEIPGPSDYHPSWRKGPTIRQHVSQSLTPIILP